MTRDKAMEKIRIILDEVPGLIALIITVQDRDAEVFSNLKEPTAQEMLLVEALERLRRAHPELQVLQ